MTGLFSPQANVFKNRDALRESWTPREIVGRDDELEELQNHLQPVIEEAAPNHMLLYGRTGVGKTATTRYILGELIASTKEYNVDASVVWQNCADCNTSYQVTIDLVNTLITRRKGNEQEMMNRTGHSSSAVYDRLWKELDKIGGSVIIVLDEIDNIGGDDKLLYQLSRVNSTGMDYLDNTQVGVIGISNDLTFTERISSQVEGSFGKRRVHFSSYDAVEIRAILNQRIEHAFKSETVNDEAVAWCAAQIAKSGGNARSALEMLLQAGELVENNDENRVTEEYMMQAREELEREEIREILKDIKDHQLMILASILYHDLEGNTPTRAREIHTEYQQFAEEKLTESNTSRWVRGELKEMAKIGILYSKSEHDDKARFFVYALDAPTRLVSEIIAEGDIVGEETALPRKLIDAIGRSQQR